MVEYFCPHINKCFSRFAYRNKLVTYQVIYANVSMQFILNYRFQLPFTRLYTHIKAIIYFVYQVS